MIVRVRLRQKRPYVVLETVTLRLKTISFKARGLWAMCMSYPDDWAFRMDHLASMSERDGEIAVRNAFKELEVVGLARLEQLRGAGGRLEGTWWVVYESVDLNPSCVKQGGLFDSGTVEVTDEVGGAVDRENVANGRRSMFQFDRDAGFTNLGENRISETTDLGENRDSVNRALRSNEKARSKEYTRNNDFDEKKQQQKTTTLDRGGDGVAAVDGCGYGAVALPSGVQSLAGVLPAAASFEDRSGLLEALVARGVDESVAAELVARSDPEHVRAMLERGAQEAKGPGWYVRALQGKGYRVLDSALRSRRRMTHAEALAYLEENDIVISRDNPMDRYLEIERESGKTYFVRKNTDESSKPATAPGGEVAA